MTPHVRRWTALGLSLAVALALGYIPTPALAASNVDIGVVSSESSKAFSAGQPPHPYSKGTDVAGREKAATTWVEQNGHNLVTLTDADLENPTKLSKVDVVIFPYTWAMTEAASLTLRNWVQQGGALIPILTSPRVFLEGSTWKLWVQELNYEAWEWGPLSEAYQMMFVNDPSPTTWQAVLQPGHPIVSDALSALSLSSAKLTRPGGSGVEFGFKYNGNVTSILDFAGLDADSKGNDISGFNGYSAAQATLYGNGRIVYFDIPLLDFLPHYKAQLADDPVGGGHDQGDLADAILDAAVDWAIASGGYGTISRAASTWGEVDSYGSEIFVRHWVKAIGTVPLSGTLTARFYNPSGRLVREHRVADLGIEPGRTHMRNWKYSKGSTLDDGLYRVVLEYRFSYPSYTQTTISEAYVRRSQGTGIPTTPVDTTAQMAPQVGNFDGNGGDDLATFSTGDGTWTVLQSTGSGFTSSVWADFSTPSGWVDRLTGDFDGDGRDDIAQFHPSNGTWWISRSTGSGFVTRLWADLTTSSGWTNRLVGDFDGDGRDDIAQFHPSNGTWWISRSTGSGFVTRLWADFTTPSGWEAVMVGDYNGDGRDDISQFHPSNGTWWISRSTGSGFVTRLWADFSTPSGWIYRMTGDFNGDGRDDIAQFHPSNGTWWISRSAGSSLATSLWADFTTTRGWEAQMVGDYNGDGRDDIAQFHPSNGTWWITRSTGSSFSTSLWADFSTASGWQSRLTGDFDNDGRDDVAQFHPSNATWWVSRSTESKFATSNWSD